MSYLDYLTPSFNDIIPTAFGAFVMWFFSRNKQKAETSTVEINNSTEIIKQYKDALSDIPLRYEEKYRHVQAMATEVEALFNKKEQILLQEIEYHKQQATYQKKQAALYKRMYDSKNKEFNDYKKTHP